MGTGASGFAGVVAALAAVESGACEMALVFRSMQQQAGNNGSAIGDPVPQAGGSRKPITMDEYLQSKLLCDPLRLYDCDYSVSGSCALIITTLERARDLRQPQLRVAAHAQSTGAGDWIHARDFLHGGAPKCAERLWQRSGLRPADIDVVQVYDGFTYSAITWIEALGFCDFGEAGDWLGQGEPIGPGGCQPLNTNGGQLAEGRFHGLSSVAEAAVQLRGDAGQRQGPDAVVAAVTVSWGSQCAGMILLRD